LGEFTVRRTPLDSGFSITSELVHALVLTDIAPQEPLNQLCAAAIIRDEHIASLSLDLKETERYALLRQAIGANDADTWVSRASELLVLAKRRSELAQNEINSLTTALAATGRRTDELRSSLYSEAAVADATARLRQFTDTNAPLDNIIGPARLRIATVENELGALSSVRRVLPRLEQNRTFVLELRAELPETISLHEKTREELAAIDEVETDRSSSEIADRARQIVLLIQAGRTVGLVEQHCPLCSSPHTDASFQEGLAEAELAAARIDEIAATLAQREARRRAAASAHAGCAASS
jgi:chromosome segregation protein